MRILDIGGEGRHAGALNLNPSRVKTIGTDRGSPISNWIQGRADDLPFPSQSIDLIIVERVGLTRAAVAEICRVIAPRGTVILRHFHGSGAHPHCLALEMIRGYVTARTIQIGRQTIQETVFTSCHVAASGKNGSVQA